MAVSGRTGAFAATPTGTIGFAAADRLAVVDENPADATLAAVSISLVATARHPADSTTFAPADRTGADRSGPAAGVQREVCRSACLRAAGWSKRIAKELWTGPFTCRTYKPSTSSLTTRRVISASGSRGRPWIGVSSAMISPLAASLSAKLMSTRGREGQVQHRPPGPFEDIEHRATRAIGTTVWTQAWPGRDLEPLDEARTIREHPSGARQEGHHPFRFGQILHQLPQPFEPAGDPLCLDAVVHDEAVVVKALPRVARRAIAHRGALTPPLGMLVFTTARVGQASVVDVFRAVAPFVLGLVAALVLITYVPALSLTLPRLIGP